LAPYLTAYHKGIVYLNPGLAFAADDDVFLASHSLGSMQSYNVIRIRANGVKQSVSELTFDDIQAADVDKEGRLNIYADRRFYRFEPDGTVNTYTPKFSVGQNLFGPTNFAVGPDGLFYCITRTQDTIKIWHVDETGEVTLLPISFDRASFGNPYSLSDARIDIGNDGRLALIVTALGSKGQGPFYQRVYQANADGTDLREVANFDSRRTGGPVDIALDNDNNIFVLVLGEGPTGSRVGEVIYRISSDMEISTFIELGPGRDPPSIDVDSESNVWFCTTVGVFRVVRLK